MMNLLVVDLSIGNNHLETEEKLNSLGFQLGDFVNVSQDKEYTKPNTNNLNTREDNDFGYVSLGQVIEKVKVVLSGGQTYVQTA